LPAYLEQQHALIAHHTSLPTVLQLIVAAYATPMHEDMWTSGLPFSADECSNPACNAVGLKRCQHCKQARYCGRECQTAHWKAHKVDCKRWGAELKTEEVKGE
jgi:hypothetical protein